MLRSDHDRSCSTNTRHSASMDSDDDFGDFTFVPAGAFHVHLDPAPRDLPIDAAELDVGTSLNKFAFFTLSADPKSSSDPGVQFGHLSPAKGSPVEVHNAPPIKPVESNSDDDWGDFVEHSAPAVWDNSESFDWFGTIQHTAPQAVPFQPLTKCNADNALLSSNDWTDGFSTGVSKVEAEHAEQKAGTFVFDELNFFGETNKFNPEGNKASVIEVHDPVTSGRNVDEMAAQHLAPPFGNTISGQTMDSHTSSISNGINSSPIPLSLFGDSEIETENSKTELLDVLQGYTRSKGRSTSSFVSDSRDLSNLIATLYTEAQPHPDAKDLSHTDTVAPSKIEDSMNKLEDEEDMVINFTRFRSSAAGGSFNLEKSMFSLTLGLEHASGTGFLKGNVCSTGGAELQSEESNNSLWLDSISKTDQCAFIEAWVSLLEVCASELEHALDVWKQAQFADVHLALLDNLQGKTYFAAIGQVYVAALILAASSNFYKHWLPLATKSGESLRANLQRCRAVWMETDLSEGVCLALNGLHDMSAVSWKGIEGFATVALEAYQQAARASVQSTCKISLLPMDAFNCLHSVEWSGASYLLPLANLWANCISQQPPATCFST